MIAQGIERTEGEKEKDRGGAEKDDEFSKDSSTISQQARKEFGRDPEFQRWHVTRPIIVKDLSRRKDNDKSTCFSPPIEENGGMQTAPNFASALLGRKLATFLRLNNPILLNTPSAASVRNDNGYVFRNVNALLLPGEATLLLGPSSSGKTTFLRTICGKINGEISPREDTVEGSVLIGSVDPSELDENLSRATAFVDQTDVTLTPVLTVEETVRFASACAQGTSDSIDQTIDTVIQLAGLDHVKSTIIGDAELRGISGGQKRRVKLLEMAVGIDLHLMALDEITNGLDAASALTICKVARAAVEAQGFSSTTALLQPSSEVFRTFHRLILLTSEGEVAYSGPTEAAVTHFQSLGLSKPFEMNEADFLLQCASSPSQFGVSDNGEVPGPSLSSTNLATLFIDSKAGSDLMAEIERVEMHEANTRKHQVEIGDSKQEAKIPDFALPTHKQILLLVGRGAKLVARNPASLQRVISSIIFGAFIGTLFLNTGSDEQGTTIRAGYVMTLNFLVLLNSASAPIDDWYFDRLTFYTHRRASFYRTLSYYIAQVIYAAPVALIETFFLAVISFYAVGMSTQGVGFVYFWILFSLTSLCGTSLSRVLAYSLPSNDIAQSLGPALLLVFILAAGYSPQYPQLPNWLKWLAWISPCAYSYEGAILNEVQKRFIGGEKGSVWAETFLGIPRVAYEDAPAGLSTEQLLMAFDAYMLIVLTMVYEILGCCLLHHSQKWFGPTTKRYQVTSGMSLTAPPWIGKGIERGEKLSVDVDSRDTELVPIPEAPRAHLTAKDIVYEVDVPIIKEDVCQEKATSDILSAPTKDTTEAADDGIFLTAREYGQIGQGKTREWAIKRHLGEGALGSSHSSTQSQPTPKLKLPPLGPGRLRLLSGISASFEPGTLNALMGSSGAGKSTLLDVLAGYKTSGHISGETRINGQPKTDRTWRSIAGYCEQVDLHCPALTVRESLVFATRLRLRPFSLPEETRLCLVNQIMNLLDLEEVADMLVGDEAAGEGLPKHARKRLTVGVELAGNPSILFADEPSSGLDSLGASVVVSCLKRIAREKGLTVVCTIHQPSREVFASFDNLLVLQKGGVCVYNGSIAYIKTYMQTAPNENQYIMPEGMNPADYILDMFCGSQGESEEWGDLYQKSEMAEAVLASFTSCTCEWCSSGQISIDLSPPSLLSELWIVAHRELVTYWRTPTYMAVRFGWTVVANVLVGLIYFQTSELLNIIGSIFFYVNIATVPLMSAVVPLISARAVYYREVASGTYRKTVYGIAVQIAELPFNLAFAVVSFLIFYFMVGLDRETERVAYFFLMGLASYWVFPTMGQLFAFLSPNIGAAIGMASLLMTLFTLTMGFLLPASEIPAWYIWIYWMNPLRYVQQGLVVNEVGGKEDGDDLLRPLGWAYDQRWWYCYVAVILFGFASSLGVVAATRISWLKR